MTHPQHPILNDQETAVDLLYFEAIAGTVVEFIRQSANAPVTIGIHGDWGAGKSSILKMVHDSLGATDRTLCIWFNGWTFEGFDDAKTVLMETLVSELRRARPGSTKVLAAAKRLAQRIDWLKLARTTGSFAITMATGIPTPDVFSGIVGAVKELAKRKDSATPEEVCGFLEKAGGYIKSAEDKESIPDQVYAFRKEFEELLKAADIDQLVVLIDDLDRCLPETAIATLEAIRLFLFVPQTAFVVATDEAMIEYSVRRHFPELPLTTAPTTYARNYLEKLIQVPFRVPALGFAETQAYITLILVQSVLGEESAEFKKLLSAAREDLRRPWRSRGLDRAQVREALGTIPDAVEEALRISEQTARILAEGMRGNPRQIKRFLNSMILRQAIARQRGFDDDVQTPALAKMMLAERFFPEFYEYLARKSASENNGVADILKELEVDATAKKKPEQKAKLSPEGGDTETWLASEPLRQWAALKPSLATIDLRPYVFVSRDRRNYFGAVSGSDQLQSLAEQLRGKAMAVRALEPELARLTPAEAEQVFDMLRAGILGGDLSKLPDGADGMTQLVRKHPQLQSRLLAFMRDLPHETSGAWLATTWAGCFSDDAISRQFKELRDSWAASAGSQQLRNASQAASKLGKR